MNEKNLKPFKKGQSGNPGGALKMPPELRKAKRMGQIEFEELLFKYLQMPVGEIKTLAKDPNLKSLDMIVLSVITGAIKYSDHARLGFLLDRLLGKVTEKRVIDVNIKYKTKEEIQTEIDSIDARLRIIRGGRDTRGVVPS